jgi:hypothetical protein
MLTVGGRILAGKKKNGPPKSWNKFQIIASPGRPSPVNILQDSWISLKLGTDRTRVALEISYDPKGLIENVGDAVGVVSRRIENDLEHFKEFIENR